VRTFESVFGVRMTAFIQLKRAMGYRYESSAEELVRFDRFVANLGRQPATITCDVVDQWLRAGAHLSARAQQWRLRVVRQFCRYLVRLDAGTFVPDNPFPVGLPRFKPHIYSADELRALLEASLRIPSRTWSLQARTIYTMLLVAYATGLRAGEVGRLCIKDVDIEASTLLVRNTKFFKSRLVPVSGSLACSLRTFFGTRASRQPNDRAAPFFLNRQLRAVSGECLRAAFCKLIKAVGVRGNGTRRPRLHDLRHTFAVHSLLRWYRSGADVQAKLPLLSIYMGHASVISTHVYLTATSELLQHASQKFERAFGGLLPAGEVSDALE
jgi:integrase/recombinase XerD